MDPRNCYHKTQLEAIRVTHICIVATVAVFNRLAFLAISLAICGPRKPGIVPIMLDIPNRMPAYFGAISRLLTGKPATAIPLHPTDRDRNKMAHSTLLPK